MRNLDVNKYIKKQWKMALHYAELTDLLSLQTRFPKYDQQTGGKWLNHGTKHRKDNQLQSVEIPCRILPKRI